MAQHGVFEHLPTQELVLEIAYMGNLPRIPAVEAQDIENAQFRKKFHDFPEKCASEGMIRGFPRLIWPNFAESWSIFLNLIRKAQTLPMISHLAAYSAFHMT
ncbi:hypothetical protein SAMN05444287_0744 [Octadecabacter temperatus]|uniref:Uncharacterized protein n=2 Tax=Octadecabacter temperatus TaxID=1458307 RepID=A0A0K0Y418_9RHOB|nr:hypothetical protein OSB_10900 [Octadecabacter temperatus]SIN97510.1 hypothetical protein SAMN05444287_0744 [Octadecabacter temperatus]